MARLSARRWLGRGAQPLKRVVRESPPRQCRPCLEPAVQLVRHVTYLDHRAHGPKIAACGAHASGALRSAPGEPGRIEGPDSSAGHGSLLAVPRLLDGTGAPHLVCPSLARDSLTGEARSGTGEGRPVLRRSSLPWLSPP